MTSSNVHVHVNTHVHAYLPACPRVCCLLHTVNDANAIVRLADGCRLVNESDQDCHAASSGILCHEYGFTASAAALTTTADAVSGGPLGRTLLARFIPFLAPTPDKERTPLVLVLGRVPRSTLRFRKHL
jgi:hypothetical protein